MASKQLGKLRQWAGEVISSREKTVVSEEFVELEKDIELRRVGAERLFCASELYHHALQKKKECIALSDPEKLLPVDSLGIVMITHGEEFGEHSDFGMSLVKFGRAHCQVATLQEAYAVTFRDTYLASIEKFQEDIREYEAVKKKLESRRLTYDAAISKLEKTKNSKKEKEKTEAEDELERAQARYEETTEDLRAHIHSIQETEIDQLRELTAFLDLEMNFVERYLEVLRETKSEWAITNSVRSTARGREPSAHALHRKSPPEKTTTLKRNPSVATRASVPSTTAVLDSTDDEEDSVKTRKRRGSTKTRSSSVASRPAPPSRPSSRASRKRADSNVKDGNVKDTEEKQPKDDKNDKDDKDKQPKRMSMAGWASSAMGSFSGRNKKSKDFATLDDDENLARTSVEENGYSSSGHRSQKSLSSLPGSLRRKSSTKNKSRENSPQIPPRILKPPSMQEKKTVRALYDFTGSSDELSFKVGDEIVVINEVLEGWWMGELKGKQGLFPTPYTEVIPSKPPLPTRPNLQDMQSKSAPVSMSHNSLSSQDPDDDDEYKMSDMDDEVYGSQPLSPNHSPFFGGGLGLVHGADAASIVSTDRENDSSQLIASITRYQEQHMSSSSNSSLATRSTSSFTPIRPAPIRRSSAADGLTSGTPPSGKKAPPPPPPRRSNTNVGSPPIPARRLSGFSGSAPLLIPPSSNTTSTASTTPGSSVSSHSVYDTSPFESSTELSNLNGDSGNSSSVGSCTVFKQNPFKPKGYCSNCLQFH
ncbi:BAR-domain-containing protein [Dendrothele bispora CBS 962.96]|uniref:BAR-domain-containing protein n=1 Tax=Dendrothele bispora (strain CBS 962.96) TaxID=1314807 RepID=A0A4S8LVF0_DENBC|nr:BAR-domain-containing protein [Dendrothele bispora CBS 962.96]